MTIAWSRRKFMVASAVGVGASPLVAQLSNLVPETKALPGAGASVAPKAGTPAVQKPAGGHDRSKCRGCQVCKIMYSNCMALNNRICWCETPAEEAS
jgi:anaerobic selenocysteine-containing dehydrogenase